MGHLGQLGPIFDEYQLFLDENGKPADFVPREAPFLQLDAAGLYIDAIARGDGRVLLGNLETLGLQRGVVFGQQVSGLLPFASIDDIAVLTNLVSAQPAWKPWTNVGSTSSQGDAGTRADEARSTFGVAGTGVTVGVLSDSFDTGPGSYLADILSGDLPPGITVIQDFPGGTDEGRAMLQIVHDVAPGASLAFATAFGGQANFAQNILQLAAAGASVIVDDVIYFAEPMFQDGVIAQAVDLAVSSGVAYFSSAGNNARQSYQSDFNGDGPIALGTSAGCPVTFSGAAHDFDLGPGVDIQQSVTIPIGASVQFSFQWDQPFATASPVPGGSPGAASDIDIYLTDSAGTTALACGVNPNIGGDPVEVFNFVNATASTQFNIVIKHFAGPAPGLIKYVWFGPMQPIEFDTMSSTVYGHANAAGAEAVGAAFFSLTPEFGVSPPVVEPFSSAGASPNSTPLRTPILFTPLGAPIFELRDKPEIVAPDGVNNTFFGSDVALDADPFPNFFGTSAAAPHAAAVAALMHELVPGIAPDDVYSALERTTIDMNDPKTPGFDVGFDFATGFGLIDALTALGAVNTVPRLPVNPCGIPSISGTAAVEDDPVHAGKKMLRVLGRNLNDSIVLSVARGLVQARLGKRLLGQFAASAFEHIVVCGFGGNDRINISRLLEQQAYVDGGDGNDTILAGRGSSILLGRDGNDILVGSVRPDLLVGGAGLDTIRGRHLDEDVVIGNPTLQDGNWTALDTVLQSWIGPNLRPIREQDVMDKLSVVNDSLFDRLLIDLVDHRLSS